MPYKLKQHIGNVLQTDLFNLHVNDMDTVSALYH